MKEQTQKALFVLLRGPKGNVFWTTDDGVDHEADGYNVLHRGATTEEMVAKWDEHYHGPKLRPAP